MFPPDPAAGLSGSHQPNQESSLPAISKAASQLQSQREAEVSASHRPELEDSVVFLRGLEKAKAVQLEAEYVMFFLREIRAGKTVEEAVAYALDEWDI